MPGCAGMTVSPLSFPPSPFSQGPRALSSHAPEYVSPIRGVLLRGVSEGCFPQRREPFEHTLNQPTYMINTIYLTYM